MSRALIALALLTGCPASESDDTSGDAALDSAGGDTDIGESAPLCDLLPTDQTFSSVDEHECGLSPHGEVYCHWQITFYSDGHYEWSYSDIGEESDWSCEDDSISGASASGTYDPDTGTLTWDGLDYTLTAG